LAKEGFDLLLASRSTEKLNSAKEKIQKAYPQTKVEISSIDLAKLTTEAHYNNAFKEILIKEVSILVNNVGYYNAGISVGTQITLKTYSLNNSGHRRN